MHQPVHIAFAGSKLVTWNGVLPLPYPHGTNTDLYTSVTISFIYHWFVDTVERSHLDAVSKCAIITHKYDQSV